MSMCMKKISDHKGTGNWGKMTIAFSFQKMNDSSLINPQAYSQDSHKDWKFSRKFYCENC